MERYNHKIKPGSLSPLMLATLIKEGIACSEQKDMMEKVL